MDKQLHLPPVLLISSGPLTHLHPANTNPDLEGTVEVTVCLVPPFPLDWNVNRSVSYLSGYDSGKTTTKFRMPNSSTTATANGKLL